MTTEQLESHFRRHGEKIRAKLLAGRWTPSPVRRVEIPKPNGDKRLLGIPTVMDRLLQQALWQVLTPIFEPLFSESSWGFRPGRSAHEAVRAAQGYVREGRDWVVDIDIAKFFDHVNHDILMRRIAPVIRDKRILRLIGRYLRAGVLLNGVLVKSEEGTPQGGPLSPLLANIYLDALDRELQNRGLRFCRYADDCNIYVSSEAAARRVLAGIGDWIEKRLRLEVNEAKSGAGRPWERKFLGLRINRRGQREVAPQSVERFQQKVREIWRSLVIHFTLVGGRVLGSNVSVGQCLTENQLFDESVEDLAYVAGLSTVEAKGEFVEVALEMHFTHLPLVSRSQPALQQRGNQVNMREFLGCQPRVSRRVGDPVAVAGFLQAPVTPPAVGMDQTAWLHSRSQNPPDSSPMRRRHGADGSAPFCGLPVPPQPQPGLCPQALARERASPCRPSKSRRPRHFRPAVPVPAEPSPAATSATSARPSDSCPDRVHAANP